MKKENPTIERLAHHIVKQGTYFEEFVFSCFLKQGIVFEREKAITINNKTFMFDGFAANGLPGITNNKTYIEIKYANSILLIKN